MGEEAYVREFCCVLVWNVVPMQFLGSGSIPNGYLASVWSRFKGAESFIRDVVVDVKLMQIAGCNEVFAFLLL